MPKASGAPTALGRPNFAVPSQEPAPVETPPPLSDPRLETQPIQVRAPKFATPGLPQSQAPAPAEEEPDELEQPRSLLSGAGAPASAPVPWSAHPPSPKTTPIPLPQFRSSPPPPPSDAATHIHLPNLETGLESEAAGSLADWGRNGFVRIPDQELPGRGPKLPSELPGLSDRPTEAPLPDEDQLFLPLPPKEARTGLTRDQRIKFGAIGGAAALIAIGAFVGVYNLLSDKEDASTAVVPPPPVAAPPAAGETPAPAPAPSTPPASPPPLRSGSESAGPQASVNMAVPEIQIDPSSTPKAAPPASPQVGGADAKAASPSVGNNDPIALPKEARAELVKPDAAPGSPATATAADGTIVLPNVTDILKKPSPAAAAVVVPTISMSDPRNVLDAFLLAPTWQERLPYIYEGLRLEPVIREYYEKSGHSDGPIRANFSYNTTEDSPAFGEPFLVYDVHLVGNAPAIPVVVRNTDQGPRVEWQSFVEFKDSHFATFMEKKEAEARIFRVQIERTSYYGTDNASFKDLPDYVVYKLTVPGSSTEAFGFVKQDTDLAKKLTEVANWNDYPLACILEIQLTPFPHGTPHFVIKRFLTDGWYLPPDFKE